MNREISACESGSQPGSSAKQKAQHLRPTTYKRSQIEDAICLLHSVRGTARAKLLSRLKRLLDIDRQLPFTRKKGQAQYAFFSEDGPGTGQEASFQEYEAFALEVATHIAAQGIPQTDVVEIFRALRNQLQQLHRNILEKPLEFYADIKQAQRDREPIMSAHPVFLVVYQAPRSDLFLTKSGLTAEVLLDGTSLWEHFSKAKGRTATTTELSLFPHALRFRLNAVKPRKKGASSR